ncbi:hypothetical protein FGU64_09815 [Mesorhizobium sp. 8]|nr:hypothetical protein FGU64_09815 [Mesorhizobium sp. 8]
MTFSNSRWGSHEFNEAMRGVDDPPNWVLSQIFQVTPDGILPDGFQVAIASKCSLIVGAGLKAKRPCRWRIM